MEIGRIFSPFRRRRTVAVDLVRLLPGGENGGVKAAVFVLLEWMGRRDGKRLRFILIANQATRDEVVKLARTDDVVWCSHLTTADPEPGMGPDTVDSDRLVDAGVDVLYCPFGPDRLGGGRIPYVSLLIDMLHREVPDSLPPEEVDHREQFFADACSRAAAVQVISDDVGDRLVRAYGLERGRLFRTYLPLHQIDSGRFDARDKTRIESRTFIYPANFWPHKNHLRLLEAFRLFLDAVPERRDAWSLVLTGAGQTSEDALDRALKEQGIGGYIDRAGYLERADYLATLGSAVGLVFPSLNEGFGIPILEAQQAGVPVICSNVSCLPEVAGTGARFVNPYDTGDIAGALGDLADDEKLRHRLIREGRSNLKRFNFEREGSRFARNLHKVCRRNFLDLSLHARQ
jgi:glycosyltransferase involved in cell wall biosynthesis